MATGSGQPGHTEISQAVAQQASPRHIKLTRDAAHPKAATTNSTIATMARSNITMVEVSTPERYPCPAQFNPGGRRVTCSLDAQPKHKTHVSLCGLTWVFLPGDDPSEARGGQPDR